MRCSKHFHPRCVCRTLRTATKTDYVCEPCRSAPKPVSLKSSKPKSKPAKAGEGSQHTQGQSVQPSNMPLPSHPAGARNLPPDDLQVREGSADRQLQLEAKLHKVLPAAGQEQATLSSQDQAVTHPNVIRSATSYLGGEQSSGLLACLEAYYTKEEMTSIISKIESSIRAEFRLQLLNLQEQVTQLSQEMNSKPPPVHASRSYASRVTMHNPSSHSSNCTTVPSANTRSCQQDSPNNPPSPPSNTLPFRIVWGTSSHCTVEVLSKAISPLLDHDAATAITIRRSVRHLRNSKRMWWFTIMAPLAVIQQLERCWPTLESKSSWSLRLSLSRHNASHLQVATQAEPAQGNNNASDSCVASDRSSNDTGSHVHSTSVNVSCSLTYI